MKSIITKYNSIGLATLPTKQTKAPYCSETWNNGITDLNKYDGCFGVGIICGNISGGLECIDFDNHFGDAKETLGQFVEQIKPLYEKYNFPIESTMSGGFHLLYRCEFIEGNQKLAQRPKYDEKLKKFRPDTIIETRGENGYFCADPTPGYKFIRNSIECIPVISKEDRKEILNHCRAFNEWVELKQNEFEQGEKPGDLYNRDNILDEVKSLLEFNGWTEGFKGQWIRPGKKQGVSATLGKAAENIFYCFTSNAYPFEPMKGYTPFQVVGLLKYSGDFKAFAKDLAERYDLKPKQIEKKKETKQQNEPENKEEELTKLLNSVYINLDVQIDKPPVALYISDTEGLETYRKRLFSLGNFSCIIGKSKSRKTFLTTMLTAAMVSGKGLFNKFWGSLPEGKRWVAYFDTEQGDYDAANNIKRINRLLGHEPDNLGAFTLRSLTYMQRCEVIEQYLKIYGANTGLVVIDGIADLAKAINDEEEATRITSLLLRWSKDYKCHILTVMHTNKNDNYATGHLGSFVMKKAEMILSTSKDKGSNSNTVVSCDYSRGIDFNDFEFNIFEGLPDLAVMHVESPNVKLFDM